VRVLVCGSRNWHDRDRISARLAQLPGADDTVIVHGNARGADRLAGEEANKLGLLVEVCPADWERHGKQAGIIRNEQMAAAGADLCIAFWDGRSTGTFDMMKRATTHGIPLDIVRK
jgi:hypothetical protein